MARGRHANPVTGPFGGAHYGATILVRGVPKWPEATLAPSVELPVGPRSSNDNDDDADDADDDDDDDDDAADDDDDADVDDDDD
eukprot:456175-Pyramimonas_sp.AAC.1